MRFKIAVAGLSLFLTSQAWASGIILHMMMAKEAAQKVNNTELRAFLTKTEDIYLNGAIYPDAGYMGGTWGEESHWSKFQNAYLSEFKLRCPPELLSSDEYCQQTFSFLFGMIAHSLGDVHFDRYFVTEVAKRNFDGNLDKAQKYTDFALDNIAIVEMGKFRVGKKFLPLDEIMNAYKIADIKAERELVRKLASLQYIIVIGGINFMAHIVYKRFQKEAPWAAENYAIAKGGIHDSADQIAKLWDKLWALYTSNGPLAFYESGHWPNFEYGIR